MESFIKFQNFPCHAVSFDFMRKIIADIFINIAYNKETSDIFFTTSLYNNCRKFAVPYSTPLSLTLL